MYEDYETTDQYRLIVNIAEAWRMELGFAMEEQPGFDEPAQAGQANRAFRIMARCILQTVNQPAENLAELVRRVLFQAARRRLQSGGLTNEVVQRVLQMEPAGRDDWYAFLILTQWDEIPQLLEPDHTEPD